MYPETKPDKKRIVVVAKKPVGGIRTYLKYIYRSAIFDGYEFLIITPKYDLASYVHDVFLGKDYVYIETEDTKLGIVNATYKALANSHYDVLHTHGFTTGLLLS